MGGDGKGDLSASDDGTADAINLDSDSSSQTSLSHDADFDWKASILRQMQARDRKQKAPFEDITKDNPVLPMDESSTDPEGFMNRRLQEVQKRLLAHKRYSRLLIFLCTWYV